MPSRVLAEVLALLAPPLCAVCRAPLGDARDLVCPACRRALPWLRGARCPRCGLPGACAPCPAACAAYERAWAPLAYEGVARALVCALKFRGATGVADLMAAQIAAGAPPGLLAGTLVPAPAHPARRRKRGFDQAERIARALSRRTGLPVRACLRRAGPRARQAGTSRRGRLAPGRIQVSAAGTAPATAVLVDDVHTTGATLDACARALRAAGARRVVAVAYARVPTGRGPAA